ncbi:MAG: hypothetical protein ACTSRU_15965 [Candidatus Hodarchaeales archaeon]
MDFLPLIQASLVKILRSHWSVQAIILTDRTGLTMLSLSRDKDTRNHMAGMGALASALFCGAAAQGQDLLGNLEITISEFKEGKILLKGTGPGIIVVITSHRAALNKIRVAMKRYGAEVQKILEQQSAGRTDENDTADNLSKALDLLDF